MDDIENDIAKNLESDAESPDTLFARDYIAHPQECKETGTDTAVLAASWLVKHIDRLQKEQPCWQEYTAKITDADVSRKRIADIMNEPFFNGGRVIPKSIHIQNLKGEEVGSFDFATISFHGGKPMLSFAALLNHDMESHGEQLSCALYYWSLAKAINSAVLSKELGLPDSFESEVVLLSPAMGHDENQEAGQGNGAAIHQLAKALHIFRKTLFQGASARRLSSENWIEGAMSEKKLISLLEQDSKQPKQFYQKSYINDEGVTGDTRVPYCRIISDWLLTHSMDGHEEDGSYGFLDQMSGEEAEKNLPFPQLRKQKVLPPLGKILPRYFTFLGSRGQRVGFPSLLVHDVNQKGSSVLHILSVPDSSDSLLSAVLKVKIHLDSLLKEQLISDLDLPENTDVNASLFVVEDSLQYQLFQRDDPYIRALMEHWHITIFVLHKGMEALA